MPAYDDYTRSAAGPGFGTALVLLLVICTLAYCHVSRDPTAGLGYGSGDRPQEMGNSLCSAETGPCPPTGFKWLIPAAGVISTRFNLDDPERTELAGEMKLHASLFADNRARGCAAVINWSIEAEGRPVAGNTLPAGDRDQPVAGDPPAGAKVITLTARRTDAEPCPATLQWNYAKLIEAD